MLLKFLKPRKLLKYLWFGFGLAGAAITFDHYFPNFALNLKNSGFVKGIQTEVAKDPQLGDFSSQPFSVTDLKNMEPQIAGQVLGTVIKEEVTKVLEATTQEVKQFPARQVKKIKIGACEELLEEDICSVAQELDCSPND